MTKISSLTALTGAGVDGAADLVPIVDMSLAGSARNKKIVVNELKLSFNLGTAADLDIDIDDTLAADSDALIPTQQAVKAYVDGLVGVDVEDEGVSETANATILNFVGAGVTAADAGGGQCDITIPGGAGIDIEDEGVSEATGAGTLNFVGAGVTAADMGGGVVDVTIPGGGISDLDDLADVDTTGQTVGDVLTFDGTEWVPTGYSGAMVHKAADETTANYSTLTAVPWTAETYDDDGYHDNAIANTRLTLPDLTAAHGMQAKKVTLRAMLSISALTANEPVTLSMNKNGAAAVGLPVIVHGANATTIGIEAVAIDIPVVGDGTEYFECLLDAGADTSVTINANRSCFQIKVTDWQ